MSFASNSPVLPSSSTHKRSFDDLGGPDLDAPSASTSHIDTLDSSSSTPGNRDRNKRPRNDSDSSYTTEVDDILLSSSTSVSSSSSGSTISSYHSAHSAFSASPVLVPLDDIHAVSPDPALLASQLSPYSLGQDLDDYPTEDALSFLPLPPIVPTRDPAPSQPSPPDSNEQFRLTMERVDAFDREIAALRRSPFPASDSQAFWQPWSARPPDIIDDTPYHTWFPDAPLPSQVSRSRSAQLHRPNRPDVQTTDMHDTSTRFGTDPFASTAPGRLEQELTGEPRRLAQSRDREGPTVHPSVLSSLSTEIERNHQRRQALANFARTAATTPSVPAPRPQSRSHPLPSDLHSLLDDFWHREHNRGIRDLDRTIREAEAHRQRIVEFLAEEPHSSASNFLRDDRSHSSTSSTFSTLRGALDDSSVRNHPQFSAPGRDQRLRDLSRLHNHDHSTSGGSLDVDLTLTFDFLDYIRDLTSTRQSRERPGHEIPDEYHSSDFPPHIPPRSSMQPSWPASRFSESYLEANRRVRSLGIAGLRNRVRPRSPSIRPPSPPRRPYVPTGLPSRHHTEASRTQLNTGYRPGLHHNLDGYLSTGSSSDSLFDGPLIPALNEPMPQYDPPAPHPELAPLPESSHRLRRYGNIDLDAYREGPFRATLERSMALDTREVLNRHQPGRTTRQPTYSDVAETSPPDPDRDELAAYMIRREARILRERERIFERERFLNPRAVPSSTSSLLAPEMPRNIGGSDSLPGFHLFPGRYRAQPEHTRDAVPTMESDRNFSRRLPETQRQVPHEIRDVPTSASSSVRYQTQRHSGSVDDETTRTTELDRWRRDMLRRALSRTTNASNEPSSSTAATPAPSTSSRNPLSHNSASAFLPPRGHPGSRRGLWPFPPAPGQHTMDARRDDRPTPLNGRFARSRSHLPPDMLELPAGGRAAPRFRRRNFGDYMRDEDIDMSYEGLLSLSSLLGDVKPRGTPGDVISSLPKGTYREWAQPGTEERCPICLDDYTADDACLRIPGCSHWFHDGCLKQWLKTARSCPVCRGRVNKPRSTPSSGEFSEPVAGPSGPGSSNPARQNSNRENAVDLESEESDPEGQRTPRWTPFLPPPWRGY